MKKSSFLHWFLILPTFLVILLSACNFNSKKQRLAAEESTPDLSSREGLHEAKSSLVLDTVIPNQGIKYTEKRTFHPEQPPVVLDFTNGNPETKDLDLADYYTQVKYVKLKFPFPEKGAFLGDTNIEIEYGRGVSTMRGNSSVFFSSENIIAGERYMGYYCYDREGNYEYTIAAPEEYPVYHPVKN
jgi:hypothetical protein